jgi:hypothetical protein
VHTPKSLSNGVVTGLESFMDCYQTR